MSINANSPEQVNSNSLSEITFIDTREVSRITGIPVATLVTWRSRGRFGPPFYTPKGTRRVLYQHDEVIEWVRGYGRRHSTADRAIIRDSEESSACNKSHGQSAALLDKPSIDHKLSHPSAMDGKSNSLDKRSTESDGADE